MKKTITSISSAIMIMFAMCSATAYGASFTAVANGAWSSAATWGGTAPSNNVTADQVHIPSGITVILDNNATFSGALSSLDVNGTLTSATGTMLTIDVGSLTGNGTVSVSDVVLNTAATLTFTGTFTVNTMRTSIGSMLTTAHYMVNKTMTMVSGTMTLQSGANYEMGNDATMVMAGGSFAVSGGTVGLTGAYNVMYTSGSSNSGAELNGSGLKDVTIDVGSGNTMTLQSDLTVNGMLSMTSGNMNLNGHNLTIMGDLAASGSGTISSTNASNITIQRSGSTSGSLRFASGANTVNNFTVNITQGNGYVMMGSDMKVAGMLKFMGGNMHTGSYELEILNSGSMSGQGSSSYVITGSNGSLSMHLTGGSSSATMFHVGSQDHYAPANIQLTSGSSGKVMVGVANDVWSQGTTGTSMTKAMVKNTWHVASDITSNMNMSIEAMWSSAMEVNAFNRSQAYLSHYTNGNWDMSAAASATAQVNGMFSIKRNNITSLSPFAVFSGSPTGIAATAMTGSLEVYPNPVSDRVYIHGVADGAQVQVIDITGQVVKTGTVSGADSYIATADLKNGNYFVRVTDNEKVLVKKFVKE